MQYCWFSTNLELLYQRTWWENTIAIQPTFEINLNIECNFRLKMTHQGIYTYFSKINSISEKISDDINSVKSAYSKEDWINLTWVEQERILNKHLINHEIYFKYFKAELCSPLQTIPKIQKKRIFAGKLMILDIIIMGKIYEHMSSRMLALKNYMMK